jgi:hypothetical protein
VGKAISIQIGFKYGQLTVIKDAGLVKGHKVFICICDCGTYCLARASSLNKDLKSCGCLKGNTTHGETVDGKATKEFRTWMGMKFRVSCDAKAKYYFDKGVVVCERWLISFDNFLSDMGRAPTKEHTLDRYPNPNGNYEPGNCRWALIVEQNRNRRNCIIIEYKGEKKTLKEWTDQLSINYRSAYLRAKRNLSTEEILKLNG